MKNLLEEETGEVDLELLSRDLHLRKIEIETPLSEKEIRSRLKEICFCPYRQSDNFIEYLLNAADVAKDPDRSKPYMINYSEYRFVINKNHPHMNRWIPLVMFVGKIRPVSEKNNLLTFYILPDRILIAWFFFILVCALLCLLESGSFMGFVLVVPFLLVVMYIMWDIPYEKFENTVRELFHK